MHRKGNTWQQVPISWEGFKPLHEYLTKHRPYLASLKEPDKVRVLTMTNHYASLNVKQLQQSHDLHSPMRTKDVGNDRESSDSGYWDVE